MSELNMQVPEHIAARIAARKASGETSALMEAALGDSQSIPKISIRASRFRLVDGGVETVVGMELDVVIVGINPHSSKAYFDKPYDPNATEVVFPACTSANGITPDANVDAPVCGTCAACPMNVLGSKINPGGAKSKLCTDTRAVAVIAAADPSKVYQLLVPISAMKAMRLYFKELSNFGICAEEVITGLSFDDGADFPKLEFAKKGFLGEKALTAVTALLDDPRVKTATQTEVKAYGLPGAADAAPVGLPAPVSAEATEPATVVAAVAAAPVAEVVTPITAAPVVEVVAPVAEVVTPITAAPAAETTTPAGQATEIENALADMFGE